jgi:formylglycine-generating enzyme required for sulfatase activity
VDAFILAMLRGQNMTSGHGADLWLVCLTFCTYNILRTKGQEDADISIPAQTAKTVGSGASDPVSCDKDEGVSSTKENLTVMNDDAFYDEVAEEMQGNQLISGVWTRAFAEADGDENRAKAIYIQLRVAKLMEERLDEEKQLTEQKRSEEKQALEDEAHVKELFDPPKSKKGCGFWMLIAIVGFFVLMLFVGNSENKNAQSTPSSASPLKKIALNRIPQEGQKWTGDLGCGVVMEFVPIPAGSFIMGSNNGYDDEKPVHTVRISKGFWMAKTEVTQRQYRQIMETNTSSFKGDSNPVEKVSRNDALSFCNKLTEIERQSGRLPEGYEYTLPTEAQWEYACRAGTTGDYAVNLDSMAWYGSNSGEKTHPVGMKQVNAWGLHDMYGNVWEWCAEWYGEYPSGSVTDPRGASSGSCGLARGGGWRDSADRCTSTLRGRCNSADIILNGLGFRPIMQKK